MRRFNKSAMSFYLLLLYKMGKRIATRLTAFAMIKQFVILSAKHERIRNTLKRKNGLPRTLRRSRLPARSVLLLRRGVHRTPAPQ